MEVGELDVRHRVAVGDRDRQAEVRDAALRVQRAVDRVDDDAARSSRAELPLAELLRDEHEVLARLFEPAHDRRLGGRVDGGRLVAALAGADDRLALGPPGQLGQHAAYVLGRRAAGGEPRLHCADLTRT